ncbi:MAG: DUF4340 domain-containing protein [Myxococcales bacterium]|nr:DUF4340 domain-containing protein [Myxococcales bacterium]
MTRTSTAILGAIAIGLFAFIVLVEQKMLTSAELREARGQLLERFVRSRVDQVEIARGGNPSFTLRRVRAEGDLLGDWRVTTPFDAPADADAVSAMLGSVQYARARRTLTSPGAEDLARYGLDAPRLIARFLVADERVEIRFGGDDPTGSGVYMSVDTRDGELVHVVGRDVFEALDHDAGHFRSKRLVEAGVLGARRLTIAHDGAEVTLEKPTDAAAGWRLVVDEGRLLASAARVEEALSAFNDLVAETFAEGEGEAFGTAWLRVEATAEREGRDVVTTLEVGAACEREGERWARVDGGPVACVLASALDALRRPAGEYREDRPITASDLEVEEVDLVAGGATLAIRRDAGVWRWTLTRGATESQGDADDEAFAAWLRAIRQARARSFVATTDAAAHGLARPSATLRVKDSEGAVEELAVGAVSTEGLYLRRGGEPQVLVVAADAEALFTASALRLRPTRLWSEAERAVQWISVERGGVRERLEREGARWALKAPLEARADVDRADRFARRLARLEVVRFVAEAASPEHGLHRPAQTWEVRLAPDEGEAVTRTLRVGAATEGGAFAVLQGDPAVFVIGDDALAEATEPFVDRGALATPLRELEAVRIGTRRFVWDGQRFREDEALEEGASDRLASAIEGIRAVRVGPYGPPAPADGLTPARVRVEVERGEGASPRTLALLVGAPTGEGGRVHVRREDLAVAFEVAEASVQILVDLAGR